MPGSQSRVASARERVADLISGRSLAADDTRRLQRIEQRLGHLETLVEGLQDAIHRDSLRHEQRMLELERKTEPEIMAKALSEDARKRGI